MRQPASTADSAGLMVRIDNQPSANSTRSVAAAGKQRTTGSLTGPADNLTTNATILNGRALAQNGAESLDTNAVFIDGCGSIS
ncbi:MAG: hypothetical protein IAF94_14530 [Pirellulaceae bacterium]|nr:hypothetical protein [Pirellulaceae bacterium]